MRQLSAREALDVWERGQGRDPLSRALVLLSSALPEYPRQQLAELSLGQRDGLLLDLYAMTFGTELQAQAACPRCGATLRFDLDCRQLAAGDSAPQHTTGSLEAEGYHIDYRLPNSADLEAMSRLRQVGAARDLLLDRCLLSCRREGEELRPSSLPQPVLDLLAERLEEHDPLAEIPLNIDCAKCQHEWQVLLEPASFLWAKVSSSADRLLYEVHTLARAYGWSEPEILDLSPARRAYYIKQVPLA